MAETWTAPIDYVAYEKAAAADMDTYVRDNLKFLKKNILLEAVEELTIDTGAVTLTKSYHSIDTEGDAATDDLDTISGVTEGRIIAIKAAHTDRTVVLKNGTGNLMLGFDIYLDDANKHVFLIGDSANNLRLLGLAPAINVASGGDSIGTAATQATVTHGLGTTPTRVFVQPTASLGNAAELYISTKGTADFTVTVDVAPGAELTFDWRASLGEHL